MTRHDVSMYLVSTLAVFFPFSTSLPISVHFPASPSPEALSQPRQSGVALLVIDHDNTEMLCIMYVSPESFTLDEGKPV